MKERFFKFINYILIFLIFVIISSYLYVNFKHSSYTTSTSYSNYPDTLKTENNIDSLEMELIFYAHSINDFTLLSVDDVYSKIECEDFFILYVGRITCQWCRKLAPILNQVALDNELSIFYLNSEGTENNPDLKNFRTIYGIDTVPAIIVFTGKDDYHLIDFNIEDNNLKEQLEDALISINEE